MAIVDLGSDGRFMHIENVTQDYACLKAHTCVKCVIHLQYLKAVQWVHAQGERVRYIIRGQDLNVPACVIYNVNKNSATNVNAKITECEPP